MSKGTPKEPSFWSSSGRIPGKGRECTEHPFPPDPNRDGRPASPQTMAVSRWRSPGPSGTKNDPEEPRNRYSFFLTLPSAADLSPSKGSTGKYSVWNSPEQVGVQALGRFFLWDTVTAADSLGFRWHCPGFSQYGTVPVPHMRSLKPFLIRSIILPKWIEGTKTNPNHPLHLE